jgi:hypothetical protein
VERIKEREGGERVCHEIQPISEDNRNQFSRDVNCMPTSQSRTDQMFYGKLLKDTVKNNHQFYFIRKQGKTLFFYLVNHLKSVFLVRACKYLILTSLQLMTITTL